MKVEKVAEIVDDLLREMFEDTWISAGMEDTPLRVAKALYFLTGGYNEDPKLILLKNFQTGDEDLENYDGIVLVRDIPFYSLCEHHLLPFFGKVHVGYIPNRHVVGLSKIPRVVNVFARRLQTQERMTKQIFDALDGHLNPRGCMVIVEAEHLCMTMRGVQAPGTTTTTSSLGGVFDQDASARAEFLALLRKD